MKIFKFYFVVGIFFLLLISAQILETFKGKVVGVTDGDSITVLTSDSTEVKIRLDGVDCPEKSQAFGTKAKQFTSDLVYNKTVKVEKTGTDKYGRTLAYILLNDTINLNKELLKAGLAWHYKKYNSNEELAQFEQNAHNQKLGLWADSLPIAPWDFRHGTSSNGTLNNTLKDTLSTQSVLKTVPNSTDVYVCNSSSSYAFHKYQCSGLNRCKSGISEISKEKAESMGRTPCKICKW